MSSTPILDLEQKPPKPPRRWIALLIGFGIGGLIVWILILRDQHRLPAWHWPAFNGLLIFPALYVVIAVHEIGHLMGGAASGIDSGGLSVGGLTWTKSGTRWVFRFN